MKDAYLIFDIGTGNSRAAVIGADGELMALAREDSVYHEDPDFDSSLYFDPDEWIPTLRALAHKALEDAPQAHIIAVSASSQRQGIVLIGKDGRTLRGFPNCDMRGAAYVDGLDWKRIRELTGLDPDGFYSCMKIRGTQKRQPELAEKIGTYTSISDWVGYLCTGKVVWERAQTAHTLVYDIHTDGWSQELCELMQMDPALLPPIALAGTVLGPVKPELIREFGLDEHAVFVVGAADTQLGLVGVQAEKGDVVAVNGTTTPITMVLDHWREVPFWISPHAEAGEYMLEVNCGATGINVQRLKDKLLSQYSYEELERRAKEKGLPKMLAMFSEQYQVPGELCTNVGFLFEEEIEMSLEPCDFMHAMFLDVAFQIVSNYRHITALEPSGKSYLLGCGGGFRNSITPQAVADLLGIEVRLPKGFDQASLYGCLHLCNRALGRERLPQAMLRVYEPQENPALRRYHEKWLAYRSRMCQMNDLAVIH